MSVCVVLTGGQEQQLSEVRASLELDGCNAIARWREGQTKCRDKEAIEWCLDLDRMDYVACATLSVLRALRLEWD